MYHPLQRSGPSGRTSMAWEPIPPSNYLIRMADGTIKQINPFTGTEVWTVPGRGHRPLGADERPGAAIDPALRDRHCAFCIGRMLETPPEKSRLVRRGNHWTTLRGLTADELFATVPEFRRIPNLFEIVSYEYWEKNFNFALSGDAAARKKAYLATDAGRRHVFDVLRARMMLGGLDDAAFERMPIKDKLASSGTMTPEEHYQYIRFTIDALRDVYLANRYVRYVAVFQNWLKQAGASFDHLHKQLVAIDSRGAANEAEIRLARTNPNIYNEAAVNYAGYRNLVFAENDHAI